MKKRWQFYGLQEQCAADHIFPPAGVQQRGDDPFKLDHAQPYPCRVQIFTVRAA
jgi:hypothetical protein